IFVFLTSKLKEVDFMKRKFNLLMMIVISVLLFSGCVKSDLNIEVNADQSGSYEITLEVDKDMFEGMAAIGGDNVDDDFEEGVKELEAQGYKVKTDDKGDNYVIVYGKDFSDVNKLEIDDFLDEDNTVVGDYSEGKDGSK